MTDDIKDKEAQLRLTNIETESKFQEV
jgi:hypothetical protein